MEKVFCVVVAYKGKQWYDRCFTSLRNSTIPVQTIVVDNASNDGTVEYIKEHYPEIILIESKENLGFGKGNNLALKYAYEHGCDYVFLLNQDAWLIQLDAIERLVQIAEQNKDYGIISPMHLCADGVTINMQYELAHGNCSRAMFNDIYSNNLKDIYGTDYINAAAWLLPRHVLETVGGFDPLFTLYGEDDDYINRVRYHKMKVGLCPKLKIIHDHSSKSKEGVAYYIQANKEGLGELLNINISYNYLRIQFVYLKRLIKAVVKGDSKFASQLCFKMKYLRSIRLSVAEHRKENSLVQPSWI